MTRELLDIIGDSVYSEYAELRQIKKQTSRIFSGDRLNAARVRELGAHVRGRLRTHVSPCPYLRRQSTPARRWWWNERDALLLCREPPVDSGRSDGHPARRRARARS